MRRSEIIIVLTMLAIGLGAVFTGRYAASTLEEEAHRRAVAELAEIGYEKLAVEVDGLVVSVSGRVLSRADQEAVVERLSGLDGFDSLVDNLVVVAPLVDLRPAILHIQNDGRTLTLTGEAPNAEARDLLGARAAVAHLGGRAVNLMKAQDRRATDEWLAAAEAAIDAVATLEVGKATVARGSVTIEGAAGAAEDKGRIETMLRSRLADGFSLEISVSAPPPLLTPYVFAARKGKDGVDVGRCAAPDPPQRSAILGALRARGADAAAAKICVVANGAPNDQWLQAVIRGLAALEPLVEGEIILRDATARVIGFVEKGADVETARVAAAAGWPDLFQVFVELREVPPVARPFALTASKRPGETRLTGHAPSQERAEAWAAALGASSELELARGAPARWTEAANTLIETLKGLSIGAVTLSDRKALVAAPGDASVRERLRGRLEEALPPGYVVEVAEAQTPRFMKEGVEGSAVAAADLADGDTFRVVVRRDRDGAVEMAGVIGDVTTRSVVSTYAKAKLGGDAMSGGLSLTDAALPVDWRRALFIGLEALAALEFGELVAENGALYLRGGVGGADAAREAAAILRDRAPEGFTHFTRVRVIEFGPDAEERARAQPPMAPGACIAALNQAVAAAPIAFGSGSSSIEASSAAVIDVLAEIMGRCPGVPVEIGGHTDSVGADEVNEGLSAGRAAAVRLSLAARGVDRKRIFAKGYGEAEPVADNETEEGRAKNRRIAFKPYVAPPEDTEAEPSAEDG